MRVKIDRDGMTVDLVVWNAYRRQDQRLVERTLEMNQGLAQLGAVLPIGTELDLAEIEQQTTPAETTRLWD